MKSVLKEVLKNSPYSERNEIIDSWLNFFESKLKVRKYQTIERRKDELRSFPDLIEWYATGMLGGADVNMNDFFDY